MAVSVTFYNCGDDKRVMSKTLTTGISANAELYDPTSVTNPRLRVSYNASLLTYNYMYIAQFGRYYFITNITTDSGGALIIEGAVDVLQTYKTEIAGLSAIVVRGARKNQSGSARSTWIEDPRLPIQSGRAVKAILFENTDLNIDTATLTSNNFVLNVAGGGAISNP